MTYKLTKSVPKHCFVSVEIVSRYVHKTPQIQPGSKKKGRIWGVVHLKVCRRVRRAWLNYHGLQNNYKKTWIYRHYDNREREDTPSSLHATSPRFLGTAPTSRRRILTEILLHSVINRYLETCVGVVWSTKRQPRLVGSVCPNTVPLHLPCSIIVLPEHMQKSTGKLYRRQPNFTVCREFDFLA